MAHNLNTIGGNATFIGRQAAWHKLGTVTGKYQTWDEIQAHGGFNFRPEKVQLSLDGAMVDAWGIRRSDNGAFLGPVGEAYTPIDHAQGFRLVDGLLESVNGAHYETAGVLGKGETVWGLADLKASFTVGRDDVSNMYLLFATSHNGTLSFSYWLTATRVVCQNTLRVATKAGSAFRVKHTRNSQTRIDEAHKALATIQGETKSLSEKLNFLAQRKITRESLNSVMDKMFPKSKDDDGKAVESVRRNNILIDVLQRFDHNDGNAFPEQRGTAYNLLNAVTEFTDHSRSSRGDNGRAESALFGSGERLKSQALEVLLETANGLPSVPVTQYVAQRVPVRSNVSLLDQVLEAHVG